MALEQNIDKTQYSKNIQKPMNTEMYLTTVFNFIKDPAFVKDEQSKFLMVNAAFCQMIGLPEEQILGKTLVEKVSLAKQEQFLRIDKLVFKDGKDVTSEELLSVNELETRNILTTKSRFTDDKGNYFLVGIVHDITQRKQTELREKSRRHALELITHGESLSIILAAIVNGVEQENPAMLCSVLLLDESGKHLTVGTATSLPKFYNDAINGIEIGIGVGSCGTAAFKNERVIVNDISSHPYWANYKALATQAKLGACWSEPIRSKNGTVLGTFAIYHQNEHRPSEADLDLIQQTASIASIAIELKQAEKKLKRAASVFTHTQEGIMITDANINIIEVNETFSKITGYKPEEILGKHPKFLQSDRQSAEFYTQMWTTIEVNGYWRGEIWNRRKNGEIYPGLLTISAVKNGAGAIEHYVYLCTDITPMKAYQGQLEHIAHYDALTNLPNRVLLADRLNQGTLQCQRRKQSLAVAFMDLDGFKAINDTYGHDVGDDLLITISQRMKDALREGDTLARLGGDEFIAIMVDLDNFNDVEPVLKRLLKAASEPVNLQNAFMQVSVSIGVTLYPTDDVEPDQLIRHADQAMYIAKQAGKNRFHLFDTAYDIAINNQQKSIDNVRLALKQHEFFLYYQPKVNLRTDEVIGVEALIRWLHPVTGLIPPLEFLPLVEGHIISLEIGEWVIETALLQISEWQSKGITLPISVNINAYQLQQSNFASRLATLLAFHPEVDPSNLELEILETSALHDIQQVSSTMKACHELGVRFALDDFGTGYSSLTYLKNLPASLIKIDRSFIQDMLVDRDDLAIVEGIIGLAKTFHRKVIAEGVETEDQGTALLALGCELVQGFGIAHPMPADNIPKWLNSWKTSKNNRFNN